MRRRAPDRRGAAVLGLCARGLGGAGRIRQRRAGGSFPASVDGDAGVVLAARALRAAARALAACAGAAIPRRTRAAGVTCPARKELIVLAPRIERPRARRDPSVGIPAGDRRSCWPRRLRARRALPWLRWDADRVRSPASAWVDRRACSRSRADRDLFAAVAVADSVTDFYRRWFEFPLSPLTRAEQAKATRESAARRRRSVGSTQRRSPARVRTDGRLFRPSRCRSGGTPTRTSSSHQANDARAPRSCRLLTPAESAHAPVEAVVHSRPHGEVFRSTTSLPTHGATSCSRSRRQGRPLRFSYVSWHTPSAQVWGWAFRAGHVRSTASGGSRHASEARIFQLVGRRGSSVTPPGMRTIRLPRRPTSVGH